MSDGVGEGGAAIPPGVWRQVLVVMERLAASNDLDEVLGLVIDAMRDCLGAERASVLEYDRETHELVASRAHGVERTLRFSAAAGLAGEAVRTRAIVGVPDCYADPRFNPEIDRRTGFRTRCMLSVPLVSFDGGLEGVAQVLNKRGDGGFDEVDQSVARALASQAAVAIRRARLLEAERRKNKIEADLRVAQDLQRAALPRELPRVEGYDIAAGNRQTEETGGDTYDVAALGEAPTRTGQHVDGTQILILMADATGHGVGPAISATQVQAMLRMGARLGAPLEQLVVTLNSLVSQTLPVGRFVTAFIGMLDPAFHRVRYVSAGQAPIIVVRADGTFEERDAGVPPLGVDGAMETPEAEVIEVAPGDGLLLLSDGYYEQMDALRQRIGVGRLVGAIAGATSAQEKLELLDAEFARFCGVTRPTDDLTSVLLLRRR